MHGVSGGGGEDGGNGSEGGGEEWLSGDDTAVVAGDCQEEEKIYLQYSHGIKVYEIDLMLTRGIWEMIHLSYQK